MKIHIIMKSDGEYSDRDVSAEMAFRDENLAKIEVEKLTLQNRTKWNEYRKTVAHLPYAHLQTEDNHVSFYIETVEIKDQP